MRDFDGRLYRGYYGAAIMMAQKYSLLRWQALLMPSGYL